MPKIKRVWRVREPQNPPPSQLDSVSAVSDHQIPSPSGSSPSSPPALGPAPPPSNHFLKSPEFADECGAPSIQASTSAASTVTAPKNVCKRLTFPLHGGKLNLNPTHTTINGKPAIFFSKEDMEKLYAPYRFTMMGIFSHGVPNFESLKNSFTDMDFIGECSIALCHGKHLMIKLTCEEDCAILTRKRVWTFNGFPMKVVRNTINFVPSRASSLAPVWISLPRLPLRFFDRTSLTKIARMIGRPLCIDEATAERTRKRVARICVELDLHKMKDKQILIAHDNEHYWQKVVYEEMHFFCRDCHNMRHKNTMRSCGGDGSKCRSNDNKLNQTSAKGKETSTS